MRLDGACVRPFDTLYYQPTTGPEVEATVRTVREDGLDVVLEGRSVGLGEYALREAEAEGRLRVAPAAGRVGEGEVATEADPNRTETCGLRLPGEGDSGVEQ